MMEASEAEELARVESPDGVFFRLKPYCVQLLDLLHSPRKTAPFLQEMACFLRGAPAHLLQPCLDYTLLPLLLLLDSAIQCRSAKDAENGSLRSLDIKELPISDNVAESILLCLEELLKKCYLVSVNQMVMVLKKLTHGALLSPSEVAEEFREGIIRCLRTLLLNLQPCSSETCACKHVSGMHPFVSSDDLRAQLGNSLKHHADVKECLLAFLRSENASPAVGHWLSLLLQTAELEVARGLRGSAKLRNEAFLTLRVLVARVGTSDALAFFLPGIVSRFSKALHASKSMISGAAGNTESIDHAVRGLSEFLVIVLRDEANSDGLEGYPKSMSGFLPNNNKSSHSVLEALRNLSANSEDRKSTSVELSICQSSANIDSELKDVKDVNFHCGTRTLHVNRTKDWIGETSERVDKLLSATFPHLCIHPSDKVRKGLADGIRGLVSNCCETLKKSKLMLLECLYVLVCDDSVAVSLAAHETLESMFLLSKKFFSENDIAEVFNRLIEGLPRVVLGSEEAVAVSQAKKLFALVYYAGPELLMSHILCSPIKTAHILNVLASCMSQSSLFAGPVNKLILSKPLSLGYLHSITELKAGGVFSSAEHSIISSDPFLVSKVSLIDDKDSQSDSGVSSVDYELPRIPPWCTHPSSQKLYKSLAGILRLIGFSLMAGDKRDVPLSLSVIIDTPLDCVRKLISDIRMKGYNKEGWNTWYSRSGSGKLLCNASTAVCILSEIIYGTCDQSINLCNKLFGGNFAKTEIHQNQIGLTDNQLHASGNKGSLWKLHIGKDAKDHLIHCVGSILHEHMAPEIWDLPIDQKTFHFAQGSQADLPLHFFRDVSMLQQIIIDGIGIFNISLEENFKSSGFMHNSIFLLLQNLICSNSQIRTACDIVLHVISATAGYSTVGHLVVANADYVVDSLCRQLRNLDLHPHIPNVLSSMLSYIGVAHEILPFLEEPMRIVSLELEVLGRHQHPKLTDPFLQAVRVISRASKIEGCELPSKSETFCTHIKTKVLDMKNRRKHQNNFTSYVSSFSPEHSENSSNCSDDGEFQLEYWEEMLVKLNDMRRYRRIVGSVAGSCLKAATPLLASKRALICLLALDIIEDGSITLSKVEGAYKHEKEAKEAICEAMQFCLFQELQENADGADEVDENRLLPAVNKIWPYLILCLKNKTSAAVVRRCMYILSSIIQISGGDFFVRRFHNDGAAIWKLLSSSPFRRKSLPSKAGTQIVLPYRGTPVSSEDMAEVSSLKIQEVALNMIADVSRNKRSASAMEAVIKKVSGLVVGIACSSVAGLREASLKALSGLSCIDSDLIWILVADIYYSLKKKDASHPPSSDLPDMGVLLPPPPSSKDYLYLQYGGENFGFEIDPSSVETVFQKLLSEDFC